MLPMTIDIWHCTLEDRHKEYQAIKCSMYLAGLALQAEQHQDLAKSMVVERPKVIYNDLTQQFVMWMHIDDARCGCLLFYIPVHSALIAGTTALCSRSTVMWNEHRGKLTMTWPCAQNPKI